MSYKSVDISVLHSFYRNPWGYFIRTQKYKVVCTCRHRVHATSRNAQISMWRFARDSPVRKEAETQSGHVSTMRAWVNSSHPSFSCCYRMYRSRRWCVESSPLFGDVRVYSWAKSCFFATANTIPCSLICSGGVSTLNASLPRFRSFRPVDLVRILMLASDKTWKRQRRSTFGNNIFVGIDR